MKRIMLFLGVNLAVMVTISIVTSVFGLNKYLTANGINYFTLMLFCLAWGMGGAFISLFLSKFIAKMSMGVQTIDPRNPGQFAFVVNTIERLSKSAGIAMPEIGVYESDEINAFATGATKNSSLVAVSTGLLNNMNENEIEGVLAHEITHISNGDMVTLTLITGVVNAFAMFLSRVLSFFISKAVDERFAGIVRIGTTIVFDILFTILGSIIISYFSRVREFKADAGAARLSGREKMIAALENLQRKYEPIDNNAAYATMKISNKQSGFMALFATHPPLEKRIEALQKATF